MAFDVSGFITISDVSDGSSPTAISMSNENHTFAASSTGDVSTAERDSFSSTAQVFVGISQYASSTNSSPTGTNYYIVSAAATNSFVSSIDRSTGIITVTSVPSGTGAGNETSTITVVVKVAGVSANISRSINLSKSIAGLTGGTGAEGVAGKVVRLTAARNIFTFSSGATISTDTNISIAATSSGTFTATTFIWTYSINGAAAITLNPLSLPTGYTLSTTTVTNDTLTVTPSGFANSDTVAITTTRDSQFDVLTLFKLEDAAAGADAVTCQVVLTSGTQIFKNNTGTSVARADIYLGGVLQNTAFHNGLTYQWAKNGTNIPAATSRTLTVTAADVTDDGSELYTCNVNQA